jgi:phage terminase small subunit
MEDSMTAKPLTAKQEAFCQAVVQGIGQADAYRMSYAVKKMKPGAVDVEASRLMDNPKVAHRLQELRAPVVEKVRYGIEQAMDEAMEAFKVAKGKEQGGAMVAAVQLRAKLNGLLIEKREDVTDPLKKAIANMPAEKAQEMMDALAEMETIRKKAQSAA